MPLCLRSSAAVSGRGSRCRVWCGCHILHAFLPRCCELRVQWALLPCNNEEEIPALYILMHHLLQPSPVGRYGSAFLADVLTTALPLVLFTGGEVITSSHPAGPSLDQHLPKSREQGRWAVAVAPWPQAPSARRFAPCQAKPCASQESPGSNLP